MKTKTEIFTAVTLLVCLMSSAVSAQTTQQAAQRVLDIYRSTDLVPGLPPEQKKALEGIVGLLRKNNIIGAKAAWQKFCNSYITRGTAKQAPKIENWILNKTYFWSGSELDRVVRGWEQKRQAVGDDAQLANIDLQNALQRTQQTVQLLSNVAKMLHDTTTAVVRKIG